MKELLDILASIGSIEKAVNCCEHGDCEYYIEAVYLTDEDIFRLKEATKCDRVSIFPALDDECNPKEEMSLVLWYKSTEVNK